MQTRSPARRTAAHGLFAALVACGCSGSPGDELAEFLGDYEREGRHGRGQLHIGREGMSATDNPFNESLTYNTVECSSRTTCRVTGLLCSLSLEKRPDGNVLVSADLKCEGMAGLWYTTDNARKTTTFPSASGSAPAPTASASSAAPPVGPASDWLGDYEGLPDAFGDKATLNVGSAGMTAKDDPFVRSLTYRSVTCEQSTRCRVEASGCALSMEKRADGNLLIAADPACQEFAGLWYTEANARKVQGTGFPPPAPSGSAAPSAAPSASPSAAPSSGAGPASGMECLQGCSKLQASCAQPCGSDLACLRACGDKTLDCMRACP